MLCLAQKLSAGPHLTFLIESPLWNADEENFCLLIDPNRAAASSETAKINYVPRGNGSLIAVQLLHDALCNI
uniref:Uncharacterized protein n=1 Tax=Anguilla anguilla TaxID=7936 RepID=A0A0E9W696_ANGAN